MPTNVRIFGFQLVFTSEHFQYLEKTMSLNDYMAVSFLKASLHQLSMAGI